MKIALCAVDDALYYAWKKWCGHLPDVDFHRGSILDLRVDAVVSPANSFGFMDGGIDLAYAARFPGIQQTVQGAIKSLCDGELPVGDALELLTGDARIPVLVVAPTMRVPMVLVDSLNPYLACRAALLCARRHPFGTLAFPGLGTGVGGVRPDACARQVAAAIRGEEFPASWLAAKERHAELVGG